MLQLHAYSITSNLVVRNANKAEQLLDMRWPQACEKFQLSVQQLQSNNRVQQAQQEDQKGRRRTRRGRPEWEKGGPESEAERQARKGDQEGQKRENGRGLLYAGDFLQPCRTA